MVGPLYLGFGVPRKAHVAGRLQAKRSNLRAWGLYTCFVGKIKFRLSFHGPKWLSKKLFLKVLRNFERGTHGRDSKVG